ncbi:MAG: phosphotransferase [Actinobacteria bacterium]|nr:phosphotransferase [Actinomycetota bacterium]MCI0544206.1 phosphotransferase [Actinomycetota bacterium]MCI0678959.1 phosphotransferase [Actinomycetota bacterium]
MDASRIAKEASRLLPLAQRVLKRYPFLTREVDHLATHSNVMFRVIGEGGQQLVLRVGSPEGNTRSNIEYEVAWLDALNRDTDLDVVRPIRTAGGSLIVDEYDPVIGKERPCVLFTWVPGSPLGNRAGPFGYRLLGQVAASLQAHGRYWRPERPDGMRRWDKVFYYGPELDPVIIGNPRFGHLFEHRRQKIISRAGELAEEVIRRSWVAGRPQVVHGDLHEWNVHVVASRIHVFDFEDVMYALPAQDVAISLYHTRADENRDEVREAFRRGYESVAVWPVEDDSQLDAFHAARQIMLMNYAARTLPMAEAEDFLDNVMPWLESYVRRHG